MSRLGHRFSQLCWLHQIDVCVNSHRKFVLLHSLFLFQNQIDEITLEGFAHSQCIFAEVSVILGYVLFALSTA